MNDGEEPKLDPSNASQRRTLRAVLGINVTQSILVGAAGSYADSTGLVGSAFDNLSDAGVYALSIYAVGRSQSAKARVAFVAGGMLFLIGIGLAVEVLRRVWSGAEPLGLLMIGGALFNSGANLLCMRLLQQHRTGDVHLRASWRFTTNDMLANLGVALSGVSVILFESYVPDLIIGLAVAFLVGRGGWEIIREAREVRANAA